MQCWHIMLAVKKVNTFWALESVSTLFLKKSTLRLHFMFTWVLQNTNDQLWQISVVQVEVFQVVTPRSVMVGYQHFRGPCCLHLQGEVNHRPEDFDLNIHHQGNLKSWTVFYKIFISQTYRKLTNLLNWSWKCTVGTHFLFGRLEVWMNWILSKEITN
jgi:hypothetical protein